ncbi:MAG: 5-formyltetrahydrofolate cyclo-ligase, partial [Nitrospiraceae bacterium]|nr:5-formyltetrahydrofolate cyclo-ligase [Nitrospiraceae bacterium]
MKEKVELRRRMLSLRDSISAQHRECKDKEIIRQLFLLDQFTNADVLLLYASFRSEADTWQIMAEWLRLGRRLLLPRVNTSGYLDVHEVNDIRDLATGSYGIKEPDKLKCRKSDVNGADFILVPGAAFDLSCNRIGYGKGYYDRLLKGRRAMAVGLAYDEQIVESLPIEPHDVVLDM